MSITILGRDGITGQAVAEVPINPDEIDLAGLEYAAFASALMVYQNIDLEGGSALAAADLLTASGGPEIAGLDRPGEATGNLFVDVEVMAEAPAATGFDPILVIADDSQTDIDIAAIV